MDKEYWDSCLFICYLQNKLEEKSTVDIIETLIHRAHQGKSIIVVSTLVLAEIRPRDSYNEYNWDNIRQLFYTSRPYIRVVAVTPRIADIASRMGVDFNQITVPDAIHVATAWSEQVRVMYTLDGDRDSTRRRSGDLLSYDGKIGSPPVSIKPPSIPPDSQLMLTSDS